MYAGRVVELGDVYTIFDSPRHPYTVGLMNSLARVDMDQDRLEPIPGQPPSLITRRPGCAFHPAAPTRTGARSAGRTFRAARTQRPPAITDRRVTSRRSWRACASRLRRPEAAG